VKIMLDGIEVFNKTEIIKYHFGLFVILAIVGIIIFAVGAEMISECNLWGIIVVIVGIVIVIVSFRYISSEHTGKYNYTVTISDNVNLVEFNERYEIISQEGKLWKIRDK